MQLGEIDWMKPHHKRLARNADTNKLVGHELEHVHRKPFDLVLTAALATPLFTHGLLDEAVSPPAKLAPTTSEALLRRLHTKLHLLVLSRLAVILLIPE